VALGALQTVVAGQPPAETTQMLTQVITALDDQGGLALILLCVAACPGICEELLCRGTLLSGLRRSLGPIGGVVVSAFLFAAMHGSPYRFVPQFILGIVLAVLVLRSGSLFPAIALHAAHNGVAVAIAYAAGDISEADAGPEVSATPALILLTIAGCGCWLVLRSGQQPAQQETAGPDSEAG
jgi:membrane protease YdiL (CAAX protease family)